MTLKKVPLRNNSIQILYIYAGKSVVMQDSPLAPLALADLVDLSSKNPALVQIKKFIK